MSKEEQQPLIENNENDNTTIGINYDSINYSMINEGDVSISNEIENPEGCTAPQASFNMINLLGKLIFLFLQIIKKYISHSII